MKYLKENKYCARMEKRNIFEEQPGSNDDLLENYKKAIKVKKEGALLFSVVGGKLSEGINFSDELGRGVVIVGLPYANKTSTELKEKMAYIDKLHSANPVQYNLTANIYYESLCIKRVNQSIGRVVRHKDDYACIVLLDHRYSSSRINGKISGWLMRSFKAEDTMQAAEQDVKAFFTNKRLSLIHICRCRRYAVCRSRWSPYH
eukprot:TRINITY_DN11043_c0_g2_i1.p3 TRINITY_DN11043_c0_g2~~TRINITY_DN11043_c0_g2_i1.p3  ORF type:complete len:203 (+),score=52.07 TRINITY_DN11043_c0_g2_i1:1901-2509(+)